MSDMTGAKGPELVGNALCLDFANTVNSRIDPTRDWIAEPSGLDAWAHHVGIAAQPAESLSGVHELRDCVYRIFSAVAVSETPPQPDLDHLTTTYAQALHTAHLVSSSASPVRGRESASGVASSSPVIRRGGASGVASSSPVIRRGGASGEGGMRFERAAYEMDAGLAAYDMDRGLAAYVLRWTEATTDRQVRWAVADSAMELLRHGPLERVGECPSCGWLFLDTSRNGRRRWCSMAMCGNRVKSARHYARSGSSGRG